MNTSTSVTTSDTEVRTFTQQLDAQGPAVVQRITTQVGELACDSATVQKLVDALHSGKSVTLTSTVNGKSKSTTFNASGAHLGYGEAYIALSLAAQQLRNAGVTGCATPEQWHAVLLGGPLNVTQTSSSSNSFASASGSSRVPGIVTLHNQGQGWGQIAQSANLQLGQVINSSDVSATKSSETSNLSPTGYSSSDMNKGKGKAKGKDHADDDDHDNGKHKGQIKHDDDDKKSDKDEAKFSTPSSTAPDGLTDGKRSNPSDR